MPEYHTFYRIVLTDPPTAWDMMSHHALGKSPRRITPETLRLSTGMSVYNTEQQARNRARGLPWRGDAYVAELRLPIEGPFRVERTTESRGHYTVWAEPQAILNCVSRVTRA